MDKKNIETLCPQSSVLLPVHTDSDKKNNEIIPNDIVLRSVKEPRAKSMTDSHDGRVCTKGEITDISRVCVLNPNRKQQHREDKWEDSRRCDFVATSTRQKVVTQSAPGQLKDYGRRARARLQQQRQERKEIKVIEPFLIDQAEKQKKRGRPSKTIDVCSNTIGKKRPRQLSATKAARKNGQLRGPDISKISTPSKFTQSTYVQLHGLPSVASEEFDTLWRM